MSFVAEWLGYYQHYTSCCCRSERTTTARQLTGRKHWLQGCTCSLSWITMSLCQINNSFRLSSTLPHVNSIMKLQECDWVQKLLGDKTNMYWSVSEIPTNCLAICFQADKALKFLYFWMAKWMLLVLAAWVGISERSHFVTQLDLLIAATSLVPFLGEIVVCVCLCLEVQLEIHASHFSWNYLVMSALVIIWVSALNWIEFLTQIGVISTGRVIWQLNPFWLLNLLRLLLSHIFNVIG